MLDTLHGHRLRVFTVVDNYTKFCPAPGVRHRCRGSDVVKTLEGAVRDYGKPKRIFCDNGTECVSKDLEDARSKIEQWRNDYNMSRPHGAIGDLTPSEFPLSCLEAAG